MTDLDPYLEEFQREFIDPDNAAFMIDRESDSGYAWIGDRISAEDAVNELFEHRLSDADRQELIDDLNGSYPNWARRSDLRDINE
ncbi:hypothetical protein [Microbacterium sp. LWO13-1.2]|uniref:hypothetical protein n=1 Tax=Microbacterium sp. LWO13-1.2 TaxID=3135262 RepID=UPI00313889CE